jgi:hypothetical protein
MERDWFGRLHEWWEEAKSSLHKRWWTFLLLFLLLLPLELVWHRFLTWLNEILDSWHIAMPGFLVTFLEHPVFIVFAAAIAVVVGLAVHAYFDTRRTLSPGVESMAGFHGSVEHKLIPGPPIEAAVNAMASLSLASGILGDFVDITFESARYGSDVMSVDAMDGLLSMLSNKNSRTPDGAISTGIGNHLVEKDPHFGVYKYLLFTVSAKLHEGKTLTVNPGDRLARRRMPDAGLQYAGWHGSAGHNRLPTHWPNDLSSPTWISVKNTHTAPAKSAENVTVLLGFANSQRTQLSIVPEAVWYEEQSLGRAHTEQLAHAVRIEAGDAQPFILFVEDKNGRVIPHKNAGEPFPPLDYDHWDVKVVVSSDNVWGFEGIIRFTQTRINLTPDQPAFTKLRDVPPRLETIQRFLQ